MSINFQVQLGDALHGRFKRWAEERYGKKGMAPAARYLIERALSGAHDEPAPLDEPEADFLSLAREFWRECPRDRQYVEELMSRFLAIRRERTAAAAPPPEQNAGS